MKFNNTLKTILFLSLFVSLLFSFASCQKSKVNKAFEDILSTKYVGETQIPPKEGIQIAELIFSRMSYNIKNVSDNQCTVIVVAPDVSEIFWNNFNPETYSNLSPEDYQNAENELMRRIKTVIENNEYNLKTTEITVPLVNGEPEITYELADAFYGSLYSLTAELSDIYSNGGKN